ncbi:Aste57867_12438 [Aphanomyces stellatus]|uniref:Palmitoyltransferase n=1 Tax=Aphanomyces stellatus TaxID=120398 RepID=A0A485KVL4_9STRA|nr:hypothetical protein As57867_012392 [Aphanomyces stellatus]VFT89289.1 Aste57867_12438 [Aphanomyces stellatus]
MKHPSPPPPPESKGSSGAEDDDGDSPKTRPPRITGLDAPHSRDQFISCSGHVVSGLAFYAAMGCMLLPQTFAPSPTHTEDYELWKWIVLMAHVVLNALLVCAWVSCETCNPGDEGSSWLGVSLQGPRWEKSRYCAVCRKTVPGMDHHCTWLNTCIGRKNYAQFFTIAVCGVVIFSIQAFVAVYCTSVWRDWAAPRQVDFAVGSAAQACFILCALVSVPCLVMYTTLLAFHVYLFCLGYGTYDYFLKRRDALRAERRKKRNAQMELARQIEAIEALGKDASAAVVV